MATIISPSGRAYLQWALTDGVGPIVFSRLLVHFGDAMAALGARAAALREVHGIATRADALARSRDAAAAVLDTEIGAAAEHGVRIVCRADPEYPPGLMQIADAPIVLFVKGELRHTDAVAVAVVGSRRCTIYGSEQARRFAELLAGAGFTVVSGLARGIDAFAHHGAVEAGGRSIAVMGRGLDDVYPPENKALAEKVLAHGAWLSELPLRTEVRAGNFPGRNRIIAGMTLGTLVVEAAQRSGALITARLASEYNREVFAVPGRVQDPMSIGTNALIRDSGAKLVTGLEDILAELGDVGRVFVGAGQNAAGAAGPAPHDPADPAAEASPGPLFASGPPSGLATAGVATLTAAEQRVFAVLPDEPVLADVVIRAAELPVGEVLAALTALQLKGLAQRWPGDLVARRRVLA